MRILEKCIVYVNSSNNKTEKNFEIENDFSNKKSDESFEIKSERKDLEKDIDVVNKAIKLDRWLPDSQKEKNRYLNDLRNNPHVKEFFEDHVPG